MKSNEHNQTQDPNQIRNKHSRRAHVGALVSSIPGVFSLTAGPAVAKSVELSHADTGVRQEMIYQAERGPQVFIAVVDKELQGLAKEVKFSPGHHNKGTTQYVSTPDRTSPGHYNWVMVQTLKGEKVPIAAAVILGADSKVFGGFKRTRVNLALTHFDINGDFVPGQVAIQTLQDPHNSRIYSVDTENIDGFHPPFGEWTSQSATDAMPTKSVPEAVVAAQFADFFNRAEQILTTG